MSATGSLTGTGTLLRLALRRDRIKLPIWTVAIGLGMLYAVTALDAAYPTAADRQVRADLMKSPAATMMSGPGYGLDNYTLGAMISNEMVLWLIGPAALMSIFLVVRHTRAEEESGRAELIRSGVVGRDASLAAALLAAAIANLAIAALCTLALLSGGLSAPDSAAVGAGIGLTGLAFAGVAAITAQLSEHSRSASGTAVAVIGAALLLRAIGDSAQQGGNAVSWLSPLAWGQQTRPFVDLRWWPLLLPIGLFLICVWIGYQLAARRDVGAGLVPPRPGRPQASAGLASPFALAVRQQRVALIGWGAGLFVFALGTGSMSGSITEAVAENPNMAKVFEASGQDPVEAFFVTMALFFALTVAAFAITSLQRLRSEERSGHTEAVLATAVGRWTWLASWLGFTVVATIGLLAVSGLGIGIGAAGSEGSAAFGQAMAACLAQLPAVLVVTGVAAALFGLRPPLMPLTWVLFAYFSLVGMFGALLDLPSALLDISPFAHSPAVPAEDVQAAPLITLFLLGAILVVGAGLAFRRRDLELV